MSEQLAPQKIPNIVLTGGPCGGKTSTLAILKEIFEQSGWRVFIVPEMATLLYSNGVRPQEATGPRNVPFRLALMRGQLGHEEVWREMANLCPHSRKIIFQDRGLFDEMPYTDSKTEFASHLQALGLSAPQTLARYDLVVHLTSVAVDVPSIYGKLTNAVRQEVLASKAAKADVETWNAWSEHPHLLRVDNVDPSGRQITFAQKSTRVSQMVIDFLGGN